MSHARELPSLPGPYELVIVPEADSVLGETVRRARAGAEEGTLVWAESQRAARTRRGLPWEAPRGNLHCGLVLRPDFDNATAQQLCTVASVAAGTAIAELVAPMTGMGFRWPGDLMINELLSGHVELAAPQGEGDPWPWMAVAVSVNVAHHPENPEPERFNSIHDSGEADHVTVVDALEQFSRHFLRLINQWAEEGYGPVREAWLQRAHDRGETRSLSLGGRTVSGTVRGIGEHGELILDTGADRPVRITVSEYFGLR